MSTTRRKQKNEKGIRLSTDVYNRLDSLRRYGSVTEKRTFNDVIGGALEIAAQLDLADSKKYLVGNQLFDDLAEARGHAIQLAVQSERPPEWPAIVFLIQTGIDDELAK